ncbi:hypothetical protein PbJCM13498_25210 [Prolixibacter bellariivorans]|uniref:NIPSNAP domain-containing protein n=1 Tax=Prolixibacter bellariivorans TaxID=314319 RepID=A0A5M4B131_9BACT|nr:hypothetical protein [Prolixibacter bellariivorans]GET33658.1 hypothetical protein PbJCM13498_25210 [Prolixibacter bellariivorans]
MKKRTLLIGLMVVFMFGLTGNDLFAQSKNLAKVYFIKVKNGESGAFQTALKQHAQWRMENGDPWSWNVYEVVNGKNMGDFIIRSGGHSWADFDSYQDFNAKGSAEFGKNVSPYIAKITSTISANDTTLVNWYPNNNDVNLVQVYMYKLKPGHGADFYKAISEYGKAIKKENRKDYYGVIWTVNGGASELIAELVFPYKNWAEMEGPKEKWRDFTKRVLGEEKAKKVSEEFMNSYSDVHGFIVHRRKDLSVTKKGM